jgi:hypothetical protein
VAAGIRKSSCVHFVRWGWIDMLLYGVRGQESKAPKLVGKAGGGESSRLGRHTSSEQQALYKLDMFLAFRPTLFAGVK